MKCLLITALISAFILAFFSHSGSALKCFKCPETITCTTNVTCPADTDRCIKVSTGGKNTFDCWQNANCNMEYIEKRFGVKNFDYRCCSQDLCNGSPITTGNKLVLGIASLLTVIQMFCF